MDRQEGEISTSQDPTSSPRIETQEGESAKVAGESDVDVETVSDDEEDCFPSRKRRRISETTNEEIGEERVTSPSTSSLISFASDTQESEGFAQSFSSTPASTEDEEQGENVSINPADQEVPVEHPPSQIQEQPEPVPLPAFGPLPVVASPPEQLPASETSASPSSFLSFASDTEESAEGFAQFFPSTPAAIEGEEEAENAPIRPFDGVAPVERPPSDMQDQEEAAPPPISDPLPVVAAPPRQLPSSPSPHLMDSGFRGNRRGVKRRTGAARAGISFPPTRFKKMLNNKEFAKRVSPCAGVYTAAVLEYLTSEILKLAVKVTSELKAKRTTPYHINLAIRRDDELNHLLKDVLIPHGGVPPHIEEVLLRKKKGKSRKTKK